MRQDPTPADGSVVLSAGPVAAPVATPGSPGDGTLTTGFGVPPLHVRLPRTRALTTERAGRIALGLILLAVAGIVVCATAGSGPLVPGSDRGFPMWEAGPLHLLIHFRIPYNPADIAFSVVLVLMLGLYGVVLAAVRSLSMRTIAGVVIALHVLLFLSAPLQLNDVFNYIGYARLGALHGVNPYSHGIATILHDPAFRFSSWHHLRSPYGWLFSAVSYPLAWLPIPVAYWVLKAVVVGLALTFVWLVARCARLLGRDPRYAVVLVALNPVYLVYAVGGFHNDFFMLVPTLAAIALLLSRRDRAAGAMVALAVAVKFTAVIALPFRLLGARPGKRRVQVLIGAVLAAIPVAVLTLLLFGAHLPDLQDQSTLLTTFSIPNVVGLLIGAGGGAPWLLRVANVLLVLAVAWLLRRRGDWLTGAGWATVALVASLAWLMPWYVVWILPLAALADNVRLRRVAIALSVFLVLTFIPVDGMFMRAHHINLMGSPVGQASQRLQNRLAG
jgi:hypothetical protein